MSLTTKASSPWHTGVVLKENDGAPTTSTDSTEGREVPQVLFALMASAYVPRVSNDKGGSAKLREGPLHPRPDAVTLSFARVAPEGSIRVYDSVVAAGPAEFVDMEALNRSPAHKTEL